MVSPCVRSPGTGTEAFRAFSDTAAMSASSHGLAARCAPTDLCAPWELSAFRARGDGAGAAVRRQPGGAPVAPAPPQPTGRTSASQVSTAR